MNPSPHLPPIGHKRQLTAPPDEDDAVLDEAKVRVLILAKPANLI